MPPSWHCSRSKTPVRLGGEDYLGVLIPSAPVPFGGALVYVPAAWIEPAEGGIDELMSVYVSMGITPPAGAKAAAERPTDHLNQRIVALTDGVGGAQPMSRRRAPTCDGIGAPRHSTFA